MAETFRLRELIETDESSFATGAETGTPDMSAGRKLPFLDATVTLTQEREQGSDHNDRLAKRSLSHVGTREATLTFRTYWRGSSAASGVLVENWQQRLLRLGLGAGDVTQDGGTISSATDGDTFVTTGATLVPGAVCRVGSKGDARADGQCGVVDTFAAGSTQLLNTLPGTPNAADVVYVAAMAHHSEGATLTSKRVLVTHATTGAQVYLFGGQLSALTINTPMGGKAELEFT